MTPNSFKGGNNPATGHQLGLRYQAITWPTPNQHDSVGARGSGFNLTDRHSKPHDLVTATGNWPTPNGCPTTRRESLASKRKRGSGGVNLHEAAHCFLQDPPTSMPGANSCTSTPRLNPRFVEMLMGYLPGWTDTSRPLAPTAFAAWETQCARSLRRLLTQYSVSGCWPDLTIPQG